MRTEWAETRKRSQGREENRRTTGKESRTKKIAQKLQNYTQIEDYGEFGRGTTKANEGGEHLSGQAAGAFSTGFEAVST